MTYSAAEDRYDQIPIRRVAHTGLQLPVFSLGLWRNFGSHADLANSEKVILTAFDHGIFSFDCSNNYGPEVGTAEQTFGSVYTKDLKPYRDELVITTKVGFAMGPGPYGQFNSRKTILNSIDHSLERMHLDYVDIFYSHRADPNTDFSETAEALAQIVRSGKALYIGISNYDVDQTKKMVGLLKDLHVPFVVNQVSYNLLNQTAAKTGLLKTMADLGAGLVAYGPVAEGLLSNRYLNGIPEDFPIHWSNKYLFDQGRDVVVKKLNQLNEIAKSRNQTMTQLSLAWLLKDPVVTSVILGTSHVEHLLENIKAADNLQLSDTELKKIDQIVNG